MALKRIYAKQYQSLTSSTTLVDVNDLVVPMKAYGRYYIKAVLFFETTAAADFKYRHTATASADKVVILRKAVSTDGTAYSGLEIDVDYLASSVQVLGSGAGADNSGIVELEGIIGNGAQWSTFKLQFAQATSDVSLTSILAGSYIEYEQVKGNLY